MKRFFPLNSAKTWRYGILTLVLLAVAWFAFGFYTRLTTENLWFQEVGYGYTYRLRLLAQMLLGSGVLLLSLIYLLGNLTLAKRWQHPRRVVEGSLLWPLKLRGLLLFLFGLGLLAIALPLHYLQTAWYQLHLDRTLPTLTPPAPEQFALHTLWPLIVHSASQGWILAVGLGLGFVLIVRPQQLLQAIAIGLSGAMSIVAARQWMQILPALNPVSFQANDPVFHQDVGFYIFRLPLAELLEFWFVGLSVYAFAATAFLYLHSGDSLSQGKFVGFSQRQQQHLCGLAGAVMLVVGFSTWLSRYRLLYSTRGVVFGASFTDIAVQLPAKTTLTLFAIGLAVALWGQALFGQAAWGRRQRWRSLGIGIGLYWGLAGLATWVLPQTVQALIVQPNELMRERPYLARTIAYTRQAFGLDRVEVQTFDPSGELTYRDIQANDLTLRNVRLWDQQPLLESNRQLQQIRLYYRFPDADVDRYALTTETRSGISKPNPSPSQSPANASESESQQVLIAGRELDYDAIPKQAQTWVNRHMTYTHGYGFTLSPVNRATPEGLPQYLVKDIGQTPEGALSTATPSIRAAIPIGEPRLYYGELTQPYAMTGTKIKELDYPSGEENVYNTYDGRGGIRVASPWQRLVFARYLKDWRMLLAPEITSSSKLLLRRNVQERAKAIAPFLRYDSDPYLVAAEIPEAPSDASRLFWMIDAYTASDRYPYADGGNLPLNYIRNSVKVVVDAYHGSVQFYIADPSDPIIQRWAAIFPELFQPLSKMPASLQQHLRYPVDFLKLQSERLLTYHMTDPQVFYNREDQWQIPMEVYGDRPRQVDPYYVISRLPTVPYEEFLLLLPFTPQARTNLIAWLAARSDGENYGKLLLYTFPKQRLIYGPAQIEARINQDPSISQQISLWNRQGSRAIQGNLLVIPIQQSLLYVEPLYLEATQNKLP
ncbi:MAG TPA: UPF0182 family protein, partial [Stenomitos sp.]